jgi:hypothetical protein
MKYSEGAIDQRASPAGAPSEASPEKRVAPAEPALKRRPVRDAAGETTRYLDT